MRRFDQTLLVLGLASLAVAATVAHRTQAAEQTPSFKVAAGFRIETIAHVAAARELAALPNGDLLVGTSGAAVMLVPNAEADGAPGAPETFATLPERQAAGVAYGAGTVAIGTMLGVYSTPYRAGDRKAEALKKHASVRTGGSGGHTTTSVAIARDGALYASIGSSCNACEETDPTRATVQRVTANGLEPRARRIRNAIAIGIDPANDHVWIGNAGQDALPAGHPYEIIDDLSATSGVADYGWPKCEENHDAFGSGANCSGQVVPHAVLPAYNTPIGLTFYDPPAGAKYAFPARYHGGLFVAAHGSWHRPPVPPRVAFFAMHDGIPAKPVDWRDPATQWSEFVGGFLGDGDYTGRPTGIAVGTKGSLFFADDKNGAVYRIRPAR